MPFFIFPHAMPWDFFFFKGFFMPRTYRKLHRARAARNDEFYTRYEDVKKECDNYLSHFFNKTIYCNCDTSDSAFVRYFLELKHRGLVRDVWHSGGLGGLDFRSPDALRMLERADIVVTNPPFSLFIPFMDILFASGKQFLVLGNRSAVVYKNIFPKIVANELWFGVRRWTGGMEFITENGICGVPAIWFTNIKHGVAPPELPFSKYVEMQKYDNADAVNINKSAHFPPDYSGVVGVPITFLEWYNPTKFQLLGRDKDFTYDGDICRINGAPVYIRLFVRRLFKN